MKKFIIKLSILVLIVGIVLYIINLTYRRNEFGSWDVPDNILIMNVGSSHAYYGLCWDEIDIEETSFNFALSGQVPSYDLRILKMYQNHLSEGGVCLIPVSWFSFVWEEEAIEGFEAKDSRYYKLLDAEYIKQYSLTEDIRYNLFPVLYAGENLFSIKMANNLAYNNFTGDIEETRWYNNAEDINFQEHAELSYKGQVSDWNKVILNEEIDAVYEMIEICRNKNITPILITFPFTKEFCQCADDELTIVFYDIVEDIVKKTDVEWYDYSCDKRFWENKELFMDSNHLNYEGAKYFTYIVYEEILEKKLH